MCMACTQKVLSIFSTIVRNDMKKRRIHTTISAKHWELLNRHTEKYETQQKVIEHALEALENGSTNQKLSQVQQFWLQIEKLNVICLVHRDIFYELFRTADCEQLNELLIKNNMIEYLLAMHYNKPLKECSLEEVIDGLIATGNAAKVIDSGNYKDDGDHYTIKIAHSARTMNFSNSTKIMIESMFKAYGVKTQSEMSENSIFMKVYKNL